MHYEKQKWKFGTNFRGQNWAVTNLPHLQESCPEIPRVEKEQERGRNMRHLSPLSFLVVNSNLPHLQEASFYSKVNSRSECPQQLMS